MTIVFGSKGAFVALTFAAAVAADLPADVDVTEARPKLRLLTDGKMHYIALIPFGSGTEPTFYGDGKVFYTVPIVSGGSSGEESFDRVVWDPRIAAPTQREISFRDGKYQVQCEDHVTALSLVPEAESKPILDGAKFVKPRWNRRAYALARDDRGNYYYVDKVREPESSKDFRLFSGPRANMKPQKMVNVVSDSGGDIFATKGGELRLILDKGDSRWVQGRKETKLVSLPVQDNATLIYGELGVYAGERLGTPCDDL
jgi:hypothetical protein